MNKNLTLGVVSLLVVLGVILVLVFALTNNGGYEKRPCLYFSRFKAISDVSGEPLKVRALWKGEDLTDLVKGSSPSVVVKDSNGLMTLAIVGNDPNQKIQIKLICEGYKSVSFSLEPRSGGRLTLLDEFEVFRMNPNE